MPGFEAMIRDAIRDLEARKDSLREAIQALEAADWENGAPPERGMEPPPDSVVRTFPEGGLVSPKKSIWTPARRKALSKAMKARWAEKGGGGGKTRAAGAGGKT